MAADTPPPEMKPRLEFGTLSECGTCHRRKREPGAKRCPDCLAISRLVHSYEGALGAIYERWSRGKPTWQLREILEDDEDYESFKSLDELMHAYERWLR